MKLILKTLVILSAGIFFNQSQAASVDLLATNVLQNTGVGAYTYTNYGGTFSAANNTNTSGLPFSNAAVITTANTPATPVGGTSAAKWISPTSDYASSDLGNYYSYRTTFDLTGIDLNSVVINGGWASNNRGRAIYVNGVEITTYTGAPNTITGSDGMQDKNAGASPLSSFMVLGGVASLLSGINTIDFVYFNGFTESNTGLFVQFSSATGSTIPAPSAIVLIGLGLIGFLTTSYRRI